MSLALGWFDSSTVKGTPTRQRPRAERRPDCGQLIARQCHLPSPLRMTDTSFVTKELSGPHLSLRQTCNTEHRTVCLGADAGLFAFADLKRHHVDRQMWTATHTAFSRPLKMHAFFFFNARYET